MRHTQILWTVVTLTAGLLAGCEQPSHQQQIVRRENGIRKTLNQLAELEANRMKRMEATLERAERRHERDVARTRQVPALLDRWSQREIKNGQEKWPVHQRRIEKELEGDMSNIERTVPLILY